MVISCDDEERKTNKRKQSYLNELFKVHEIEVSPK